MLFRILERRSALEPDPIARRTVPGNGDPGDGENFPGEKEPEDGVLAKSFLLGQVLSVHLRDPGSGVRADNDKPVPGLPRRNVILSPIPRDTGRFR